MPQGAGAHAITDRKTTAGTLTIVVTTTPTITKTPFSVATEGRSLRPEIIEF